MKYQNIPFQPEEGRASSIQTVHIENNSENNSFQKFLKRNKKLFIVGGSFALLSITLLCSFAYMKNISANEYDMSNEAKISLEATGDTFTWGELKSSFCKTSCTNPCAKFPSMYGELCCNWTPAPGGGAVCALGVTASGTCTCGTYDDSSSIVIPALPPAPVPVPAPKPPVSPPTPVEQHHPTPGNDGGFFHPFPTMKWEPIVFNPFPTMAWLPFNPIGIPEGATLCKKSCQHPCSQSQSNGESFCCEATASGSCSTTQINGQCYCS